MSTSPEAPALIQYACERCKTRFVLPPSSRKLSIGGKFKAMSTGIGRAFKFHEGLGGGYDAARRQLLAKMDDEAYQSFVQSFRFCHECRQFVCNECWSTSRRSCLTCVAKSMTGAVRPRPPFAPTGPEIPRPALAGAGAAPRRGRLRRDLIVVALGLAVVMLVLEAGVLAMTALGPGPTPGIVYVTPSPSPSATADASASTAPSVTPTLAVTANPTASPTDTPSPSPTATPSPTAAPTAVPTATRRPTAAPTIPPLPKPVISCSGTGTVTCTWLNASSFLPTDTKTWLLNAVAANPFANPKVFVVTEDTGVQLKVTRGGTTQYSNDLIIQP